MTTGPFFSRLSSPTMTCPASSSSCTRYPPTNPAEPVTNIFICVQIRFAGGLDPIRSNRDDALWQRAPDINDDLVLQSCAIERAILRVRRRQDDDVRTRDQLIERHEAILRQIGIVAEHFFGLHRSELAQLERKAVAWIVAVGLERHAENADGLAAQVAVAQAPLEM